MTNDKWLMTKNQLIPPALPCVCVAHVLKSHAAHDPPSARRCLSLNFRMSQSRSVVLS
jgi:hypothetical protein